MQCSHPFIHHPDEIVQNYMQPIDRIILMSQDTNTLSGVVKGVALEKELFYQKKDLLEPPEQRPIQKERSH